MHVLAKAVCMVFVRVLWSVLLVRCICVSMLICMYVSMLICVYVVMLICMYISMLMCVYVVMLICMYISMSMFLCTLVIDGDELRYERIHICMYVCMYVCISICMRNTHYTHTRAEVSLSGT
jgi:hypothetical protein